MPSIDIAGDARRTLDIIKNGGVAIVPNDTGYACCGGSMDPLQKIYATKQRGGHKRNAMAADLETQRELQTLSPRAQAMVEALVVDHDLPLGVIGSFRPDHPLLRQLGDEAVRASSAVGTIGVLLNAGPFHKALTRLSREEVVPLFGSSANLTGTGTRFRVEDIQPELRAIADITIDYGLRRYHVYRRAGTLINFDTLQVIRMGACYELISGVLKRWFDVDLPEDPGVETLPSGHLNEFALQGVQ
ncbi:Sua5/YciO/YrdC/YwlC family protein [Pseudacidovorax sp. RU35E]|uniref:Sua5/YciO/YrdC/YwlC family protein n=1 Tax=Pseudacidovorax sp. RU35E TaxID=1907403 RepID=UPI000955286D|nr:Sua5/YciO/YrdC/YwlC family protein [Pseudacidovorax sp. RU35E]SIR20080.1 tRNA A37 threonylcarbamoyladenosine synthetase subunit TsaC/SUA5/YrdC [Pseudacidovorax sp. RU35E]